MSKIQNLPQRVLDAVTPYLLTGELIDKAILQDNKKPKEIWIIKTNQAIIFHGQQPDKPQPSIMVMALDEIREIDYLQKPDDIQVIFYSAKNNGKAIFHFEPSVAKDLEEFLENLGDLITFRYQAEKGKITVVQRALRIGDKDRRIFGRGKAPETSFLAKNLVVRQNDILTKPAIKTNKDEEKPTSQYVGKTVEKLITNNQIVKNQEESNKKSDDMISIRSNSKLLDNSKSIKTIKNTFERKNSSSINNEDMKIKTSPNNKIKTHSQIKKEEAEEEEKEKIKKANLEKESIKISKPLSENNSIKVETQKPKISLPKNTEKRPQTNLISHLQEKPVQEKKEEPNSNEVITNNKKEIDYGNPVFFISITIIATIIGFISLLLLNTISKIVRYFKGK